MKESFSSPGYGMILAVTLIYLVMVAQFRSFLDPFIILFAVSVTGAAGSTSLAQSVTKDSLTLSQPAQVEPYEQANIVAKASGSGS